MALIYIHWFHSATLKTDDKYCFYSPGCYTLSAHAIPSKKSSCFANILNIHQIGTVVSAVVFTIRQKKFKLSSPITIKVPLFGYSLYSSAGLHWSLETLLRFANMVILSILVLETECGSLGAKRLVNTMVLMLLLRYQKY